MDTNTDTQQAPPSFDLQSCNERLMAKLIADGYVVVPEYFNDGAGPRLSHLKVSVAWPTERK